VSLYDCLRQFTKREVLGKDDAWYCPSCKAFQQASKQLDVFRCPEILIIHLKRFLQVNRNRREKLTVPVDFPIKGLDLSPFLPKGVDSVAPVYDLFAVSVSSPAFSIP
jgi:ubiquitin carboxyl-terminal hydrolase 4/11/15